MVGCKLSDSARPGLRMKYQTMLVTGTVPQFGQSVRDPDIGETFSGIRARLGQKDAEGRVRELTTQSLLASVTSWPMISASS